MTSNDIIEVEGATVEDAIRDALAQLGAGEDDVTIEVLSTPRSGLLGLGARRARVRVARRAEVAAHSRVASPQRAQPPPAPAHPSIPAKPQDAPRGAAPELAPANLDDQSREALEFVKKVLDMMGERAEATVTDRDVEGIAIDIKGDGSGVLIGHHGQTLDALEYLVNRLMARQVKEAVPIILDVAAYRARRRQQLERMALSMGERAKREHQKVALDPMPPRDRRVIHLVLKDDPLLTTHSVGSGYIRALEIVPVDLAPKPAEHGAHHQQPAQPVGQQGGFKRGQKRIV